jgi:hypothetical protein
VAGRGLLDWRALYAPFPSCTALSLCQCVSLGFYLCVRACVLARWCLPASCSCRCCRAGMSEPQVTSVFLLKPVPTAAHVLHASIRPSSALILPIELGLCVLRSGLWINGEFGVRDHRASSRVPPMSVTCVSTYVVQGVAWSRRRKRRSCSHVCVGGSQSSRRRRGGGEPCS